MTSSHRRRADGALSSESVGRLRLDGHLGKNGATSLIDYPRGVSTDEETLRILQGLVLSRGHLSLSSLISVLTASVPAAGVWEVTRQPATTSGWPAKSGFIQPAIDLILLEGLNRSPNVRVFLGREVRRLAESENRVDIEIAEPG